MVSKVHDPSSAVASLPKPRNVASPDVPAPLLYSPAQSACHTSIMASGTAAPSPSSTRNVSRTGSPSAPLPATQATLWLSVRPRCRNGPAVCEGVGVQSVVIPFPQTASPPGHATQCQNDSRAPTPASSFPGQISTPDAAAPFHPEP